MSAETDQYICRNCGVICEPVVRSSPMPGPAYIHPEPWRTLKARRICATPAPLRPATNRERRTGALDQLKRDNWISEEQLTDLAVAAGSQIEVGVVGCYAIREQRPDAAPRPSPRGWGYLASDGHYGLGATVTPRKFDGHGELGAEARALFWAIRRLVPVYRVTVVTDYPEIKQMVDAWRRGDLTAAPPGYNHDRRPSGREAKLDRLARRVSENPGYVAARVVDDYADTPLGAGANRLATTGWRWAAGELRKTEAIARGTEIASKALGVSPTLVPRDDPAQDQSGGE